MILIKTLWIIFIIVIGVVSRITQIQFAFSRFGVDDGLIFLDKMSFSQGEAIFTLKSIVEGKPYGKSGSIMLQAIPKSQWNQFQTKKCQHPLSKPYLQHNLIIQGQSKVSSEVWNNQHAQTYYFVLRDCQKHFISDYDNNNLKISLILSLKNNGKQIGEQQDHWLIVPVIIIIGLWLIHYYKGKINKQGMIDMTKMILFSGIATQLSSLIWRTVGFLAYWYYGYDYIFFHVLYLLMHSISQSMILALIVLIGCGWTLNYINIQHMQAFSPIIVFVAFMNIVVMIMTKIGTNVHDRHHPFDTISGQIIVFYRCILLIVFILLILNTYQNSRYNIKKFIIIFGILGSLYIASVPIVVLMANLIFQIHQRNEFIFISVESIKLITNICLTYMISSKKSQYTRINYFNSSFLPQDTKMF